MRAARPADFAAVGELTARVFVDEGFVPAESDADLRDVAARASATTLLVAVVPGGEIVGAVSLVPSGSAFAQIAGAEEVEVRMLATDPAARGRGVGRALMAELAARARADGARQVVLSTQPSMHAAQRLYLGLGYRRVPERDWVNSRLGAFALMVYALEL